MQLRFWTGRGGFRQIGAGEIGMAGKCGARFSIDEEANAGDGWEVGVEGLDDGKQGESFRFDARGLSAGKGPVEVDDGQPAVGWPAGPRSVCARPPGGGPARSAGGAIPRRP